MKIHKSTIVIYIDTQFDPRTMELSDLAREAERGDAICTSFEVENVEYDALPEAAADFFNV